MHVLAKALLAASLPVAGSALYITYLHRKLSKRVKCKTTTYLQDISIQLPPTAPSEARQRSGEVIFHHERAATTLEPEQLGTATNSEALTRYLRHTMTMFANSPPSWAIWFLLKDPEVRRTFSAQYINSLHFRPGDRVCGVYVVTRRSLTPQSSDEKVYLAIQPPKSYTGPVVEGILVAELRDGRHQSGQLFMTNHTIMWREKGKGSPAVLESAMGRSFHALMVRRLVDGGVRAMMKDDGEEKRV